MPNDILDLDIEYGDLTLAELRALRNNLIRTLSTGAKRIRFQDRDVEIHSAASAERALKIIDAEIQRLSGKRRKHVGLIVYDSGRRR